MGSAAGTHACPAGAKRKLGGRAAPGGGGKTDRARLGGVDHSADHHKLLWAFDDKGSEFFTLRGGRILEHRSFFDSFDLVQQVLGHDLTDAFAASVRHAMLR